MVSWGSPGAEGCDRHQREIATFASAPSASSAVFAADWLSVAGVSRTGADRTCEFFRESTHLALEDFLAEARPTEIISNFGFVLRGSQI
jgi:hypothetical protein